MPNYRAAPVQEGRHALRAAALRAGGIPLVTPIRGGTCLFRATRGQPFIEGLVSRGAEALVDGRPHRATNSLGGSGIDLSTVSPCGGRYAKRRRFGAGGGPVLLRPYRRDNRKDGPIYQGPRVALNGPTLVKARRGWGREGSPSSSSIATCKGLFWVSTPSGEKARASRQLVFRGPVVTVSNGISLTARAKPCRGVSITPARERAGGTLAVSVCATLTTPRIAVSSKGLTRTASISMFGPADASPVSGI